MRLRSRRCVLLVTGALCLGTCVYLLLYSCGSRWYPCSPHIAETVMFLRRSFLRCINHTNANKHVCQSHNNIGFLKTHKCASTSLQNIFFRYGLEHNLTFVLPASNNYLSRQAFSASHVVDLPWHHLGYNILALHTKWNHEQVASIMPQDTVYVTIVRNPLQLFKSFYSYTEQDRVMSLEQFARQTQLPSGRMFGILGRNQMMWDLGASDTEMDDADSVRRIIETTEQHFHLVMVAERMEESLVLLRHLLCWPVSHVVSLRLNSRNAGSHVQLSAPAQQRLRRWLSADFQLYKHFRQLFDEHVRIFGVERMRREVSTLRHASQATFKACGAVSVNSSQLYGSFALFSRRVLGYAVSNNSLPCINLARGELQFVEMLRQRQLRMVMKISENEMSLS